MFGGYKEIISIIGSKIKTIFEWMLSQNNVNNEQLALTLVWVDNKDLFQIIDKPGIQLLLLEILSNIPTK